MGEATGWAVSGSFFQDVRKTKNGSFIRPELGTGSIHHGTFPGSPYGVSVKWAMGVGAGMSTPLASSEN